MVNDKRFIYSMFFLRASVFLVIFMWTIDKFINPGHSAKVFENFYALSGLGNTIIYAIGAIELVILVLFLIGVKKTFTYGAVLLFHGASTLSAFGHYFTPFQGSHLLFFAAWPMLAACVMLFLFRKEDSFLQVGPKLA